MENSKLSKAEAGKLGALKKAENTKKRYEENPKRCKYCDTPIPYEKRFTNKFCNHSCSASYNNLKRGRKTKKCMNCEKEFYSKYYNAKFCSNKCQHEYTKKEWLEKWKSGEIDGSSGIKCKSYSKYIRNYLFENYGHKCSNCGWGETNPHTGKIPLEVEHLDGNSENNSEENLTLLCPNCHSLTATYKGANKGKGRHFRRERYKEGKSY